MSEDNASDKPKKKSEGESAEKARPEKKSEHWWEGLVDVASTVSEKFGIAAVLMLLLLASVKIFGGEQTQDDFIRSFLFGSFKHKDDAVVETMGARIVFGTLALGAMAEWVGGRFFKQREKEEMERLNKENLKLQNTIESLQAPKSNSPASTPPPALPPAPAASSRDKETAVEQASPSQGKESPS